MKNVNNYYSEHEKQEAQKDLKKYIDLNPDKELSKACFDFCLEALKKCTEFIEKGKEEITAGIPYNKTMQYHDRKNLLWENLKNRIEACDIYKKSLPKEKDQQT